MGLRKPKEGDLVKACLQWLKLRYPSGVFWRQNSGATKIGDRFIKFGSMPGVSDIVGVLPVCQSVTASGNPMIADIIANFMRIKPFGRFCAIECKMPKGRLQPSQAAFIESVQRAGGIAGVVRSIEDLERLVGEN